MRKISILLVSFFLMMNHVVAYAVDEKQIFTTAILPFNARGAAVKDYGVRIADALFARLVLHPEIDLVDRQELNDILNEYQLNLSGMVNQQQAVQVGQLSGAKLLITGTITELDNNLIIVAKVISTETSKVLGESVTGRIDAEILPLVEALADKIVQLVVKRSAELVADKSGQPDPVEIINVALGKAIRPSVTINVPERHVGIQSIDPAAETELLMLCQKTGFKIFDKGSPSSGRCDILITGEGFSEFAGRRGDLISVKARLEVKAVDQSTGGIIAVDRQTGVVVDLSEQIAGKKALEQAAQAIAVRLLPLLIKNKP